MASRSYHECPGCHVRLLIIRGVPPLNWAPDPLGTVAVSIPDPRRGRFLGRDEQPGPLEHRYGLHIDTCTNPRRRRKPATPATLKTT